MIVLLILGIHSPWLADNPSTNLTCLFRRQAPDGTYQAFMCSITVPLDLLYPSLNPGQIPFHLVTDWALSFWSPSSGRWLGLQRAPSAGHWLTWKIQAAIQSTWQQSPNWLRSAGNAAMLNRKCLLPPSNQESPEMLKIKAEKRKYVSSRKRRIRHHSRQRQWSR